MLFQSFEFLVLCPLVVLLYFVLPVRFRWVWVLLASWGFYMYWNPWYIFLLVGSTVTDYCAGLMLGKTKPLGGRKLWLYLSVVVNLGLLAIFKYFNFFSETFGWLAQQLNPDFQPYLLDVLLPIGISFYTFQTLGYTIDVYRGKQEPVSHFGRFAVYVAFFPQLVAGPIERANDLLPQLHFNYAFDTKRITEGLRLFLWGLFKKLVIADRIGVYVGMVYASPQDYNGLMIWIACCLFCFQIYYDFSAYQDMALGTARVLGIKLSKNFENLVVFRPSFQKFWQGWHMTLTNWIRDYAYKPMVGRSRSKTRFLVSLMVLFFLIGLWHGAQWTYIIWGSLQGIYIIGERSLRPVSRGLKKRIGERWTQLLSWALIFNLFSWSLLFFRAGSLSQSLLMLKRIFTLPFNLFPIRVNPGMVPEEFYLMFILLAGVSLFEYARREYDVMDFLNFRHTWQRWLAYTVIALAILFLQIPEQKEFIYFEF